MRDFSDYAYQLWDFWWLRLALPSYFLAGVLWSITIVFPTVGTYVWIYAIGEVGLMSGMVYAYGETERTSKERGPYFTRAKALIWGGFGMAFSGTYVSGLLHTTQAALNGTFSQKVAIDPILTWIEIAGVFTSGFGALLIVNKGPIQAQEHVDPIMWAFQLFAKIPEKLRGLGTAAFLALAGGLLGSLLFPVLGLLLYVGGGILLVALLFAWRFSSIANQSTSDGA